ncbi:MAG: hypothetical protein ABH879_05030 [archaeon]
MYGRCNGFFLRCPFPEACRTFPRATAKFKEELERINKNTTKSYYVLQEFFARESREVALNIKQMDGIFSDAESLKHEFDLGSWETAGAAVARYARSEGDMAALKRQIRQKKALIAEKEANRAVLGQEISTLKKSRAYADLRKKAEAQTALQQDISGLEGTLRADMFVIERAMRKYQKISLDAGTLHAYLEDSVAALLADDQLLICGIVEKLSGLIENNTIELKDRKRQKCLRTISNLTRDRLSGLREGLLDMNKRNRGASSDIAQSRPAIELKGLETRFSELDDEIPAEKEILQHLKDDLAAIDQDALLNDAVSTAERCGLSVVMLKNVDRRS